MKDERRAPLALTALLLQMPRSFCLQQSLCLQLPATQTAAPLFPLATPSTHSLVRMEFPNAWGLRPMWQKKGQGESYALGVQ